MAQNIMTKEELINRVENFAREIFPSIKAINESASEDSIGTALVVALVTPNEDGHGYQFTGGVMGRGDGMMQILHDLDGDDCGNWIKRYCKFRTRVELHKMHDVVKDALDYLGELEKKHKAEQSDSQKQQENNDPEGDNE